MNNDKCIGCQWEYNGICTCSGVKPCNVCEIVRKTEKKAVELGQRFDSLHDNLTAKLKGGETNGD